MPEILGAGHIALTVRDMDADMKFWSDKMGLDVTGDKKFADEANRLDLYGLKKGDCIIQAGSFDFRGEDEQMAKPMIFQEGYQKQLPLIVMRDGEKISLPLPKSAVPARA